MAEITVNTSNNQVILTQNTTNVVQVNTPGPRGHKGLTGETGPAAPVGAISGSLYLTGSLSVSSSFVDFTNATFISGSTFSGTHITASGNISASGDLIVNNITASNKIFIQTTGAPSNLSLNRTDGKQISFIAGLNGAAIRYDNASGSDFSIHGMVNPALTTSYPNVDSPDFSITESKIGIGTFLPSEKLTVEGNISASGFISASSFSGDGSGLTNVPSTTTIPEGTYSSSLQTLGNITSSGDISASGNLFIEGSISASSVYISASAPNSLIINSGVNDNAAHIFSTDDRVNIRLSDNTTNTTKIVGVGAETNDLILRSDIGGAKFRVGGSDRIDVFEIDVSGNITASGDISASGELIIGNNEKLYLNKSEDTYIQSMAGDIARVVAGGNQMLILDYDTGNRAVFGNGTKVYIGSNNNALPSAELQVQGMISGSGNLKIDGSQVDFTNLPTSDPGVAGRLYNDSGTVKISAG
jgi:hypothetical protein